MRAAFGTDVEEKLKPRLTAWEVVKRVAIGVYNDGFIHAGNLAYLSIVALFPFFIVAAAVAHLLGQSQDAMLTVTNILRDRKSTRLNSSHMSISYAVFCLKKKKKKKHKKSQQYRNIII